jgi:hypothetical protein
MLYRCTMEWQSTAYDLVSVLRVIVTIAHKLYQQIVVKKPIDVKNSQYFVTFQMVPIVDFAPLKRPQLFPNIVR